VGIPNEVSRYMDGALETQEPIGVQATGGIVLHNLWTQPPPFVTLGQREACDKEAAERSDSSQRPRPRFSGSSCLLNPWLTIESHESPDANRISFCPFVAHLHASNDWVWRPHVRFRSSLNGYTNIPHTPMTSLPDARREC
jgi:hypothetical protein